MSEENVSPDVAEFLAQIRRRAPKEVPELTQAQPDDPSVQMNIQIPRRRTESVVIGGMVSTGVTPEQISAFHKEVERLGGIAKDRAAAQAPSKSNREVAAARLDHAIKSLTNAHSVALAANMMDTAMACAEALDRARAARLTCNLDTEGDADTAWDGNH